jgi:NodT family efflux transporter outer membrane factor (OMF) lipoprotein
VTTLPERFDADSVATDSLRNLRWWRAFQDPSLNRYLETVLAANLDLTEAVTRVEEARALAGVATADLLPSLTGNGEISRSDNPNNAGFGAQIGELLRLLAGDTTSTGGDGGDGDGDGDGNGDGDAGEGGDGPPDRFAVTNYTASLGMAYEVDLWGRARNDRKAALADVLASEADLHAVRLGVLAEAITAWFEWVELDRRVTLTAEIVDVLQERVVLTETRYDRGLVGSFELYQIRQDLQNTQAGLPLLRAQLADVRRRLALLAGRFPSELAPLLDGDTSPLDPAQPVPSGIPADLLIQRPDVRAEGRRMEAARYRVGARKAELLPSLNLSGTLGLQAVEPEGILDLSQWFSNLVAGVTAPLFQGGRLRANLDAAEARYARQVAVYGRAVLTAVGEVEVALVRHRQERERYEFLLSQLEEAEASVELQADRYAAGVGDYPDYLDALRNRLTVESTLTQARRDLALARLQLHRALGGSWSDDEPVRPTWADPLPRSDDETSP